MTLAEIEATEKEALTCADVAPVLGIAQYTLHRYIMEYPERIGFPVVIIGNRVKIPRRPFLSFMGRETR